jgi:hypothetical protein
VHVQDISTGQVGAPSGLTAKDSQQRFADYALDADRNRLLAVCEDHSKAGQEPTNSIAAIGTQQQAISLARLCMHSMRPPRCMSCHVMSCHVLAVPPQV